jgi:carboxymethylenebutenolidase
MIKAENITVAADDGHTFNVPLCGGGDTSRPVVLLYPAIFGIEDRIVAMAHRWAEQGYLVAIVDFLSRAAPGGVFSRDKEGIEGAKQRWNQVDVQRAVEDSRALLAELDKHGYATERFGALGYCAGGEMAWLASTHLGAAVVAGFHPSRLHRHLQDANHIKGVASFHFGGDDPAVPLSEVSSVQAALATNPLAETHVYGATPHGFTFIDLPSYRAPAESASFQRTAELLRTHLAPA